MRSWRQRTCQNHHSQHNGGSHGLQCKGCGQRLDWYLVEMDSEDILAPASSEHQQAGIAFGEDESVGKAKKLRAMTWCLSIFCLEGAAPTVA